MPLVEGTEMRITITPEDNRFTASDADGNSGSGISPDEAVGDLVRGRLTREGNVTVTGIVTEKLVPDPMKMLTKAINLLNRLLDGNSNDSVWADVADIINDFEKYQLADKVRIPIHAYRVEYGGSDDVAIAIEECDPIQLILPGKHFESDAHHARKWAKENGFNYYEGDAEIEVCVKRVT
jgi:hypothetical protein